VRKKSMICLPPISKAANNPFTLKSQKGGDPKFLVKV
jgi:hypothetical protein